VRQFIAAFARREATLLKVFGLRKSAGSNIEAQRETSVAGVFRKNLFSINRSKSGEPDWPLKCSPSL
jgi:hypothetical protein